MGGRGWLFHLILPLISVPLNMKRTAGLQGAGSPNRQHMLLRRMKMGIIMRPGFEGFQGSEEKANLREKGSIKDVWVSWCFLRPGPWGLSCK